VSQKDPPKESLESQDGTSSSSEPTANFAKPGKAPGRSRLGRRRVLQVAGAVAVAGVLGGGGYVAFDRYRRFGRAAAQGIADHRVKLSSSTPKMVIARGKSPARNVQAALASMGGMQTFVSSGDVVLVKPNIGWERTPLQAGNTNPEVVAELVRACLAAGAKEVIVTDCPVHDAEKTFKASGIQVAAAKAGARVILPHQSAYRVVTLSQALGAWDVLEPFVTADKIINVPIVKHHGAAGVTAGMKNWIGVTTKRRSTFHTRLNATISELAALMRPTLTVLDATRVLLRNGPKGGSLGDVKQMDAIVMSVDPVAADGWAAELLKTPTSQLEYLALAERLKLGQIDYRKLNPKELTTG
jgi:uncharacterized protein (DUF362 family)